MIDARGEHDLAPRSDADWEEIVSGSATLAEAANALMIPQRARDKDWNFYSLKLAAAAEQAYQAAENELDPVKRAALFIAMNDMVVGDPAVIPVVYRPSVSGISRGLKASLSGWDNVLWDLRNWYRDA